LIIKLSYSAFLIFSNVREVNLVYPMHNGSCQKQQMINNDKLSHGKPQLQLWIDSLNEMFLSRWTAHEQGNITFMLLKTRREEGHQFVNLLPDRHAKFVIENCDTLTFLSCSWQRCKLDFQYFFHHGSLNVIGDKFRFVKSKLKSR
jgi:hypothetical protein